MLQRSKIFIAKDINVLQHQASEERYVFSTFLIYAAPPELFSFAYCNSISISPRWGYYR